jgi:hypothetical protein
MIKKKESFPELSNISSRQSMVFPFLSRHTRGSISGESFYVGII